MSSLAARNLAIGHGAPGRRRTRVLAASIDFQLEPGQALVMLGPNGAGKTTLMRTLLGLQEPLAGAVLLGGRDARSCTRRERARWLAYVPQARRFEFSFRVLDLVAMGSAPHLSAFSRPGRSDYRLAQVALERLGIGHLAHALESDLSGGEQQLVLLARALTQRSQFLLLDEPTANLDLSHQVRVLSYVAELVRAGLGVIMISHSPAHAFMCGTHAALFDRAGGFTLGPLAEQLTEARLSEVYGIAVRVMSTETPHGTLRTCVPEPQLLPSSGEIT